LRTDSILITYLIREQQKRDSCRVINFKEVRFGERPRTLFGFQKNLTFLAYGCVLLHEIVTILLLIRVVDWWLKRKDSGFKLNARSNVLLGIFVRAPPKLSLSRLSPCLLALFQPVKMSRDSRSYTLAEGVLNKSVRNDYIRKRRKLKRSASDGSLFAHSWDHNSTDVTMEVCNLSNKSCGGFKIFTKFAKDLRWLYNPNSPLNTLI